MSIFGPIIDGGQVETWVTDTLKLWWRTYAREFELQHALPEDALPDPRSWIVAEDVEREGTDQLPAVVIVSPGLNGDEPIQQNDGRLLATWSIGVGIFVSAATRADTKKLVRQYTAIIRAIMLQKQSLGGHANAVHWTDESYDDNFNFTDELTISAGQVILDVAVADVINRFAGPVGPPDEDTQPGSEWHTADTVDVDLVKEG
jgi:hypothetical protein